MLSPTMHSSDAPYLTDQERHVILKEERHLSPRTLRMYEAIRGSRPRVAVERGQLMTESFRATEGKPLVLRWALALKHVAEHLPVRIGPDELIVGRAAPFLGRYAIAYPELDGAYMAEAAELLASRVESAGLVTPEDKAAISEMGSYWKGKTYAEAFAASLPESTRRLLFGPDLRNLTRWTFVAIPTAHMRNSQNWVHDYAKVLRQGFRGIRADAEARLAALATPAEVAQKGSFLQAVVVTCEAIVTLARRYAAEAARLAREERDPQRRRELEEIAATCERVPEHPARSFREAVQAQWFTAFFSRLEQKVGGQIGNGRMDQYLKPFYGDIAEGRLSREAAIELLQCVWLQMYQSTEVPISASAAAIQDGYAHFEATTVGGRLPDGRDATNETSFLILDSVREWPLNYPELAARVHSRTPDRFLHAVAESIKEGKGIPKLLNDEEIVPFYLGRGARMEEANDYAASGCMETRLINRETHVTGNCAVNYGSLVEMTFRNGRVKAYQDAAFGPETGDPREFKSYDELWSAFAKQHEHMVRHVMVQQIVANQLKPGYFAAPMCSALHDLCVADGKDIHTMSIQGQLLLPCLESVGFATAVNSLAAVKKLVFEDRAVAMAELLDAMEHDFEGAEVLRQRCLNAPKYGNADPYTDTIARQVERLSVDLIDRFPFPSGDRMMYRCIPITIHIPAGRIVCATPDGRNAGLYLSEGITAFHGTDLKGPTAALVSCANAKCSDGNVVAARLINQKFTPSAVAGEQGTRRLMSYIRAWSDLKLWHVQFNVVNRETLLAAKKDPEKFRDLVVRVAGYSAYFVELSPALQDEIIARTEHAVC